MSRPLERDRPFQAALIVAILFHLSALTVFSIVVRFQKAEVPYSSLILVDSRRLGASLGDTAPGPLASVVKPTDFSPLSATPRIDAPFQLLATNERITIPSLVSSLRRLDLQIQQVADPVAPKSSYDFGWSLATSALQGAGKDIRHGIERLALIGYTESGKPESTDGPGRIVLNGVADGYDVSVEWISPPYNRHALYTPRIVFGPVTSVSAPGLAESLSLFVQVNVSGNVTMVIPRPIQDPGGVVENVVATVKRYQFEPLPADAAQRDQTCTLIIEPGHTKE